MGTYKGISVKRALTKYMYDIVREMKAHLANRGRMPSNDTYRLSKTLKTKTSRRSTAVYVGTIDMTYYAKYLKTDKEYKSKSRGTRYSWVNSVIDKVDKKGGIDRIVEAYADSITFE